MTVLLLLASFALIVGGALLFTNADECWRIRRGWFELPHVLAWGALFTTFVVFVALVG